MRIIKGIHKGKKINAPKSIKARPTTDFAKEALFNILENRIDIEGLEVLDIFGGIGNMSYEFASRGAKEVITIDKALASVQFINKTSKELSLPIKCLRADAFVFLTKSPQKTFDIIFADPPYEIKGIERLPNLILENKWLKPDGILIIEHGKQTNFDANPYHTSTRKYGNVNFSFFDYHEE